MKKLLFSVLIVLLMTGCSVDYELRFSNNKINETIDGKIEKELLGFKSKDDLEEELKELR